MHYIVITENSVLRRDKRNKQLLKHQSDVMAHAGQHGVQGVTQGTFERASSEPAVRFHVTDGRLDSTAPLDHRLHRSGDAPAPPGQPKKERTPFALKTNTCGFSSGSD